MFQDNFLITITCIATTATFKIIKSHIIQPCISQGYRDTDRLILTAYQPV